jgi:hypothetical protein
MVEEIMSRSVSSKTQPQRRTMIRLGVLLLVVMVIGSAAAIKALAPQKTPVAGPISRQILLAAESNVKVLKPGPTLGALDYAYIASAYSDTLQASNQADALFVSESVMHMVFPSRVAAVDSQMAEITKNNRASMTPSSAQLTPAAAAVLRHYTERYQNDGHTLQWDGIVPKGQAKWVSLTGAAPFTPRAGDWKRWVVSAPITVSPPPVYGSAEDNRQMNIVRQAVAGRNGEDINIINFWAGQPGSETPSGIWQNVMFGKVHSDISQDAQVADKQYAVLQSTLAQTLSDAFMECWKVKYTYWTARPDMRMPGLSVAMDDPNFPGYVSGHATVSKAAADVLSALVPRYASTWEADADQARNSRLVAGIHFDSDNAAGYEVGSAVAIQFIQNLHLKQAM